MGYQTSVFCPKEYKADLLLRLVKQLENFNIPIFRNSDALGTLSLNADVIVDALFGFSFKPPVREPFIKSINLLQNSTAPVVSVDIPSSWDVDEGPAVNNSFVPKMLVSLTAPKLCSLKFEGVHYLGGRFINKNFAEKWSFDVPEFQGISHVAKVRTH